MPTKLTKAQQMKLLRALPAHRKTAVKKHCKACQMKGEGFGDILKSIASVMGPIVKEVAPSVLRDYIMPFIKKKMQGKGLRLAGQRGKGSSIIMR
jgi:hypothetical protein